MMPFPRSAARQISCSSDRLLVRLLACSLDMSYMTYQFSITYRIGMTYQADMTYRTSRLLHARIHTYTHMYDIIFTAMFHVKHLYSAL